MLNLLKTIAFVTPAAVLAGSLIYGSLAPEGNRFSFDTPREETAESTANSAELQQATPEILHRMELKEEAISDFVNGRMSFRETLDRFAIIGEIYQDFTNAQEPSDVTGIFTRQIRSYVEIRLHADPRLRKQILEMIDRESAEACQKDRQ